MKTKSYKPGIDSVRQIQEFVGETFLALNSNKNKQLIIDLVIEEVVVNIVRHGCLGIENRIIDVGIDTTADSIILEISDNGSAFNPLEQENPDVKAGLDQRHPGGLGIFLVKQIAKDIQYERKDNKNFLRLYLDL